MARAAGAAAVAAGLSTPTQRVTRSSSAASTPSKPAVEKSSVKQANGNVAPSANGKVTMIDEDALHHEYEFGESHASVLRESKHESGN